MTEPESDELPPPPGWRDDKLSELLGYARNNQFVIFAKKRAEYALLREIDSAFLTVGENLINPKNPLTANLFYRSHSAYRAACGTSMAGQAPETFVLLRSRLEYAAWALHLQEPGARSDLARPPSGRRRIARHEEGFFGHQHAERGGVR
jgi:hypothetical protein